MSGTQHEDRPFSPRELDILEDALASDRLEWPADTTEAVRERYTQYRAILDVFCAIPLEDVDPDLLAPVLREASALPKPKRMWLHQFVAPLRQSRLLVPTATIVATACAVLWLMEPSLDRHELPMTPEPDTAGEIMQVQPTADAPEPMPAAVRASVASEDDAPPPVEVKSGRAVRPPKAASRTRAKGAVKQDVQVANPAEVTDKDHVRGQLERADHLRNSGGCTDARQLYRDVADNAGGIQRARALAGISLCAEAVGEVQEASSYMQQARSIAAIDDWADRERKQMSTKAY